MRALIILSLLLLGGCSGLGGQHGDLLAVQREAAQAYTDGDYARATRDYRELAQALPSDADMRYRLGNSLAKQGDVQGAMAAYREAVLRDSGHAKAWHNLVYLQLQGVGHTVAEMYLHLDRNDPRIAPVASKAEAVLKAFDVPVVQQEP
ncbi:tetratricopeptide repeat protein [Pseudomonas sp. BMS12]|uniref:tetratricopeptide repeat protein n=1 Tax=Pseudomonas sp. BMS12 TaxID=1796033 RepID=UPI00083AB9D1|nr:tetratricopeptide repeat protein [Pseudomonas sp. BMS12]